MRFLRALLHDCTGPLAFDASLTVLPAISRNRQSTGAWAAPAAARAVAEIRQSQSLPARQWQGKNRMGFQQRK
ncbi:MAG: hypothetical protein L0Y57_03830 [Beijerinckiaceae bacterium]|nr:hypothetical protein [Beijerinckiaceae bacterium]